MPWVEVECPNETCPGREATHTTACVCKGSGRVMGEQSAYVDCDAAVTEPLRWMAWWSNATLHMAGEWGASIHCPRCGEEGEDVG
jgi:hypothetical protein